MQEYQRQKSGVSDSSQLRKSLFSRGKLNSQMHRMGTLNKSKGNNPSSEQLDASIVNKMPSLTTRGGPTTIGLMSSDPTGIGHEDDFEEDEDFEFEEGTTEHQRESYLDRVIKDFDSRKTYEEIILRILNYYQRSPQRHPAGAENFHAKYKKHPGDTRKRTLFLDLDDLLISVSLFQHPSRSGQVIDIHDQSGKIIKMYLYIRPGLLEFLEETSKYFELILFNNGSQVFTEAVLNKLTDAVIQGEELVSPLREEDEPQEDDDEGVADIDEHAKQVRPIPSFFSHILSKEQCSSNDKGHEIKNINFLVGGESGRDLKDCIIVDNSLYCFQNHLTNGLFVPNYNFSDVLDDWLPCLQSYLIEKFTTVDPSTGQLPDARGIINRDIRFEEILNLSTVSQIKQMMNKHSLGQVASAQQAQLMQRLGSGEVFDRADSGFMFQDDNQA